MESQEVKMRKVVEKMLSLSQENKLLDDLINESERLSLSIYISMEKEGELFSCIGSNMSKAAIDQNIELLQKEKNRITLPTIR